jgi:hypothetical protein
MGVATIESDERRRMNNENTRRGGSAARRAPFRHGLTARNLTWAVGIPRHLKVYPVDVRLLWPVARRGRPRRRHVPDILSMPAEHMLAGAKW